MSVSGSIDDTCLGHTAVNLLVLTWFSRRKKSAYIEKILAVETTRSEAGGTFIAASLVAHDNLPGEEDLVNEKHTKP